MREIERTLGRAARTYHNGFNEERVKSLVSKIKRILEAFHAQNSSLDQELSAGETGPAPYLVLGDLHDTTITSEPEMGARSHPPSLGLFWITDHSTSNGSL